MVHLTLDILVVKKIYAINSKAQNVTPPQEKQPHVKFNTIWICLKLLLGFPFHHHTILSFFLLFSTFSYALLMLFKLGVALTIKDLIATLFHIMSSDEFNILLRHSLLFLVKYNLQIDSHNFL